MSSFGLFERLQKLVCPSRKLYLQTITNLDLKYLDNKIKA